MVVNIYDGSDDMIIGITVICCMLLFCLLVGTVYFSKSKIKSTENKLYSRLVIITMIGLVTELLCFYFVAHKDVSNTYKILNEIVNKGFLVYLLLWEFLFTEYMFFISFESRLKFNKKLKNNKGKIIGVLTVMYLIMSIIIINLPIYYFNDENYIYSYGPATNVLLLMGGIFIIVDIFSVLSNIKNIKDKKYYPLFMLIIMMVFVFIIRQVNPGITIINSAFAFVTVLMYFTIENPDLKMVNELLRNKELVEKQMEDKSRFLFEVTEDIKEPAKNILMLSDNFYKLNEKDQKDAIKIIRNRANGVLFKINNVLDISSMDASKIKIFNNEYNVYTLFEVVEGIAKTLNKNENVSLKFDINSNIPAILYGDDVRLKQILISVLTNSINNTKTGFINVSLSAIVKYDVARLIINIEDTGCGMSIDKINTILDDNRELSNEEVVKLDKLDMDLVATIKSIKLLGGSFNIKSEENKGSTFTIIIDQKCDIKEKTDVMKDIEKYSSDVFGRKRVLIVDDDKEELFEISDTLSKYNVDINTTMSGKDCIYKIKSGEIYNLIIIDDELKNESALGTLQELKKNKKFNSKVIVMLGIGKKHLRNYYIEDGFTDVIIKENLTDELIEKIESNL